MSETLEIVIKADDKASGTINNIGNALKTGLTIGLGAVVAGAGAMVGGLAFSINEAMAAQEVQAQLESVLKSTGGAAGVTAEMANGLATSFSGMTRFEDDAILSGENMLLTFTNIGKDVFPDATQAILDMSTATKQDLVGSSVQLGKALNDPIAGISALSRVGVTFSEDQKNMIASLMETGDVAGAQKIILAELSKEFGGSAEAAGKTFPGQLDILKNSLGNMGESIGTAVLPFLTDLVGKFSDWVNNPQTQAFIQNLVTWLSTNLPVALQFLSDMWTNTLQPALTNIWGFISGSLIPIFTTIFNIISTILAPWIAILAAVWQNVLKPALEIVWGFIQNTLFPLFQDLADKYLVMVQNAIQKLSDFWTLTLKPALEIIWKYFNENILPIFEKVRAFIVDTLGPKIKWLADEVFTPLANTLKGAVKEALDWLHDKLSKIADFLKGFKLPDWLTGHSPTPFEMGLRGIIGALDELSSRSLPEFSMGMNRLAPAYQGSQNSTINNNTLNVYSNSPSENIIHDFGLLESWAR